MHRRIRTCSGFVRSARRALKCWLFPILSHETKRSETIRLRLSLLAKSLLLLLGIATFGLAGSVAAQTDYARYRDVSQAIPALPPIPADNSITEDRVTPGQTLYWDRHTSKTGATSCAFCHNPVYYGAEPMDRSLGVFGDLHAANAHTVPNPAFHPTQFFNGSPPTLEAQALGAI